MMEDDIYRFDCKAWFSGNRVEPTKIREAVIKAIQENGGDLINVGTCIIEVPEEDVGEI